MTRDSEGERPQKTVAELLAQHGGQVGGAPRRRRRRAADDDDAPSISDTAPQAIIDRVRAEGPPPPGVGRRNGAAPAPPPPAEQTDEAPLARGGRPPRVPPPPQGGTGGYPVPPPQAPEEGGRPLPPRPLNGTRNGIPVPPAEAPPGRRGPSPEPPGSEGTLSARLDGLEGTAADQGGMEPPAPSRPGTGRFPLPPRRRRPPRGTPPPPPEPSTEQFPAVAGAPDTDVPHPDEPPAGLAGWRRRRQDTQNEDTEVGVMPVVPQAPAGPEEDDDEGPPTGFYTPNFDDDDEADGPDGRYHAGLLEDDPLGEQRPHDPYAADYEDDYAYDEELDDRDELAGSDLDEDEETASPAKQWLALAGQLALGVAGGAAVWLGFNWLWGQLPAAALIAALVVTVGLVWIVRKVRRAEDLQTTVLALLVGLVVTVSPAALLLVSR